MSESFQEFKDIEITCVGCGKTFVFTIGEQEFFAEMKFENAPRRCKPCRIKEKARRDGEKQ